MAYHVRSIVLCTMLLSISGSVWCEEQLIPRIQEERIAKKAEKLARDFTRRSYLRKAVYTASGAIMVYQGYYFLKNWFEAAPEPTSIVAAPKLTWSEWIHAKETWIAAGKGLLGVAATVLTERGFGYISREICDTEEIAWFVHNRTTYLADTQNALAYAHQLERALGNEADQNYARGAFISACDALMRDMERVLSYMEWRHRKLKGKRAAEAIEVMSYLTHEMNEFAEMIEAAMERKIYQHMTYRMTTLQTKLERELCRFARIEKTVWIDAAQLNDLAHRLREMSA